MIFAACFTLRGHDTHNDFLEVIVSGRHDLRAFSLTSLKT